MKQELLIRYPQLEKCVDEIEKAKEEMIACYERGGKILLCGNGGSAADCEHIAGELMKGFLKKRLLSEERKKYLQEKFSCLEEDLLNKVQKGLPAISLPSLMAVNTAFANDVEPDYMYAQSVMAFGNENDILIGISTSGNAVNVLNAVKMAKALDMTVIGLTGCTGGKMKKYADVCICAPENETYKVQELHLPIYHYLCAMVEDYFYKI